MSSNASEKFADFESVKARMAEIADAVDDEGLSLDEALDLYEEAVALGLKASDLLEVGIAPPADGEPQVGGDAAGDSGLAAAGGPAAEAPASAEAADFQQTASR